MIKKIIVLLFIGLMGSCAPKVFKAKWTQKEAPDTFKARFETTQGNFDIVAERKWSPKGVDRLYQLIKFGFYNDVPIFRVVPKFVAQFGIHNDSVVNNAWRNFPIDDEPVVAKNDSMAIAFARSGVKTRTAQIFINLKDNHRLDTVTYNGVVGFPVIAKITNGMENVLKFYDQYGDKLGRKQDSIQKFGNAFLREKYPKVDYIKKAYFMK